MSLPNTLRLTARSVTDPTWPHCPMPGDRLSDSIVVASVNYREKDDTCEVVVDKGDGIRARCLMASDHKIHGGDAGHLTDVPLGTHEFNDGLTGDMFTVILLNPRPPFYTVVVLMHHDDEPGTYKVDWAVSHDNIVPAVNGQGDDNNGYTDMGGDY